MGKLKWILIITGSILSGIGGQLFSNEITEKFIEMKEKSSISENEEDSE